MIKVKFVKLSDRWFVDIPYEGNVSDLEMVFGADTFLDCYAAGQKVMYVSIYTEEDLEGEYSNIKPWVFEKIAEDSDGTTYSCSTALYRGDIWLCPVFNLVMGGKGPEKLYITVDNPYITW